MTLETMLEDRQLDTEVAYMKKMTNYARSLGQSDEEIANWLISEYGNHFKPERIKRLIKTGQ